MSHLVAIHHISRGIKGNPPEVKPGSVWLATKQEVSDLIPMNAARQATDEEIAAFEKSTANRTTATVDVSQTVKEPATARATLEARANELGVKFSANLGDEKLAERVADAEAAAARKALEEKATVLEVSFTKDTSDEQLAADIATAEADKDALI